MLPGVMGRGVCGAAFDARRRVRGTRRGALVAVSLLSAACAKPVGPELLIPDLARVRIGSIDAAALESVTEGAPPVLRERSEYLVDVLWEAGCPASEVVRPSGTKVPDVICRLPGRTPNRIVVLAQLDGKIDASGVPRHWRGSALLPFLYQALGVEEREHSFEFAAFGKGPSRRARDYRAWLDSTSGGEVRAFIEIVSLGPHLLGFSSTDAGLSQDLLAVGRALGRPPDSLRPLARPRFRRHSTPTIAFVSPGGDALPAVGAGRSGGTDTYQPNARLIALYLGYLDETLRLRAKAAASGVHAR
jgi:hypothetical protein